MLLSGEEIRNREGGDLRIDPFDPDRINPNSYNLTLHDELLIYEEIVLDAAAPNRFRRVPIPAEGITLQPNLLYLGRSVEYTQTHGLVPMIQGRSSISRLGLFVNPGGGVGDAGYEGTWTIEMHCVQPVRIYAGMQICQIYYLKLDGLCCEYNSEKYQHSRDIQPSQLFQEFGGVDDRQMELNFEDLIHGTETTS
ncbi:MAG: dCTP deaminase [Planctomycetota bacterium]